MNTDKNLDFVFIREAPISIESLWDAWTKPDLILKWFCPRPWKVSECEIDLKPGGIFRTVMQSPAGEVMPANVGTYLLVQPYHRLIWTNAMLPEFRLKVKEDLTHPAFFFVVDILFEKMNQEEARLTAKIMHQDDHGKKLHEEMGFHQGWSIAFNQLVEAMQAN